MTPREIEEYRALRETIRQRGTAKLWLFASGITAWSALALAAWLSNAPPAVSLIPLVALAAAFEAVFAVHTGVERIGRYIQVFFEGPENPGWEHRIMAFGAFGAFGRTGTARAESDAIFSIVFIVATLANLLPTLTVGPTPIEIGVMASMHAILVVRILTARRAAAGQRARDLEAFGGDRA